MFRLCEVCKRKSNEYNLMTSLSLYVHFTDSYSWASASIMWLSNSFDFSFQFSWQDCLTTLTNDLNVSLNANSIVHVSKPMYFQMLGHHIVNLNPINFRESQEKFLLNLWIVNEFLYTYMRVIWVAEKFTWWKVVQAVATYTTDKMRMHEYMFNQNILRGFAQLPTKCGYKCENFMTTNIYSDAKFCENISNGFPALERWEIETSFDHMTRT